MQVIAPHRVPAPLLPRLPQPLRWLAAAFRTTTTAPLGTAPCPEPTALPEQHPALPWWFDQSLM
jgi:hypothetical protein